MPRPIKCRNVENFPDIRIFKPDGIALPDLEPIILGFEELESLRLADFEAKKHEEAAQIMNISRATFGRIVEKARYIVADAILNGKAILIQGGEFCSLNISKTNDNIELTEIFIEKQKKCLTCAKYLEIHNIPSSQLTNNALKELNMSNSNFKIAVVSDDGIKVSQHFGSAQFYEVFTVENAIITKHEKLEKFNPHAAGLNHQHQHQHGANNVDNAKNQGEIGHGNCGHSYGSGQGLHGLNHQSGDKHKAMLENISDCEYLIARGMGFGIYQHLEIANIKPIITDIRLIEDAVKALIDGTIVSHTEKLH